MRDCQTCFSLTYGRFNLLEDIEVVKDILEGTVIGQAIQEILYGLFRLQCLSPVTGLSIIPRNGTMAIGSSPL